MDKNNKLEFFIDASVGSPIDTYHAVATKNDELVFAVHRKYSYTKHQGNVYAELKTLEDLVKHLINNKITDEVIINCDNETVCNCFNNKICRVNETFKNTLKRIKHNIKHHKLNVKVVFIYRKHNLADKYADRAYMKTLHVSYKASSKGVTYYSNQPLDTEALTLKSQELEMTLETLMTSFAVKTIDDLKLEVNKIQEIINLHASINKKLKK